MALAKKMGKMRLNVQVMVCETIDFDPQHEPMSMTKFLSLCDPMDTVEQLCEQLQEEWASIRVETGKNIFSISRCILLNAQHFLLRSNLVVQDCLDNGDCIVMIMERLKEERDKRKHQELEQDAVSDSLAEDHEELELDRLDESMSQELTEDEEFLENVQTQDIMDPIETEDPQVMEDTKQEIPLDQDIVIMGDNSQLVEEPLIVTDEESEKDAQQESQDTQNIVHDEWNQEDQVVLEKDSDQVLVDSQTVSSEENSQPLVPERPQTRLSQRESKKSKKQAQSQDPKPKTESKKSKKAQAAKETPESESHEETIATKKQIQEKKSLKKKNDKKETVEIDLTKDDLSNDSQTPDLQETLTQEPIFIMDDEEEKPKKKSKKKKDSQQAKQKVDTTPAPETQAKPIPMIRKIAQRPVRTKSFASLDEIASNYETQPSRQDDTSKEHDDAELSASSFSSSSLSSSDDENGIAVAGKKKGKRKSLLMSLGRNSTPIDSSFWHFNTAINSKRHQDRDLN